jgi:hypothetical protein
MKSSFGHSAVMIELVSDISRAICVCIDGGSCDKRLVATSIPDLKEGDSSQNFGY